LSKRYLLKKPSRNDFAEKNIKMILTEKYVAETLFAEKHLPNHYIIKKTKNTYPRPWKQSERADSADSTRKQD
jgi:hypothetical protein